MVYFFLFSPFLRFIRFRIQSRKCLRCCCTSHAIHPLQYEELFTVITAVAGWLVGWCKQLTLYVVVLDKLLLHTKFISWVEVKEKFMIWTTQKHQNKTQINVYVCFCSIPTAWFDYMKTIYFAFQCSFPFFFYL